MENPNNTQQEIDDTLPNIKPLTFWKGVLYGLVIIGTQSLVGGIVAVAYGMFSMDGDASEFSPMEMTDQLMNVVMGIALPLSFLLAVFILLSRRKLHPNAWQWKGVYLKLVPLGLLMLFCFNHIVEGAMTHLPNYEAMLEDYQAMFDGIDIKYLFIGGVIVGPICEEIIFRGIIEEGFINTYNGMQAVLYSALIFGVIHLLPLQVINAFLAGILLGWIYWKTRSLWIVIILHVLNNFVAFQDLETGFLDNMFSTDLPYWVSFPIALLVMYGAYYLFQRIIETGMRQKITS